MGDKLQIKTVNAKKNNYDDEKQLYGVENTEISRGYQKYFIKRHWVKFQIQQRESNIHINSHISIDSSVVYKLL